MGETRPQLGLFAPQLVASHGPVRLHPPGDELLALADRVPERVRFGTSSWAFPGWRGVLWSEDSDTRQLARHGLAAYARHPLLRTVGIDRTFYGPIEAAEYREYAAQVPDDFRFLAKAHEACVVARWPVHPRYGNLRGQQNPRCFDAGYAAEAVVGPFVEGLGGKAGVLLFQLTPRAHEADPLGFAARLEAFLAALPRGPLYAVELRDPGLLTPAYAAALRRVGAEHCITVHPTMPSPRAQFEATGGPRRRALVMRWMLHRGHTYASAKARYAPFDRLVEEDPATRSELAALIASGALRTLVIVNNKAEGSSPLSIAQLAKAVAG